MASTLLHTAGIVWVRSANAFTIDHPTSAQLTFNISGAAAADIVTDASTTYFDFATGSLQFRPLGQAPSFALFNGAAGLVGTVKSVFAAAPTIAAGFGAGASVTTGNGTTAFLINVGTGGTASGGTIGLPTATTGWHVTINNVTNGASSVVAQLSSTVSGVVIANYSRTAGTAAAWAASDILNCSAIAY